MAKLNQKLIAERLDLSTTTVSRCFTNHPKINPETRAKVFQLAAEMGYSYTIQRNASSKKPTNRKKIAVIVGVKEKNRGESDIATELISGIAEKCAAEKLDFERAAQLRDRVHQLKKKIGEPVPEEKSGTSSGRTRKGRRRKSARR